MNLCAEITHFSLFTLGELEVTTEEVGSKIQPPPPPTLQPPPPPTPKKTPPTSNLK